MSAFPTIGDRNGIGGETEIAFAVAKRTGSDFGRRNGGRIHLMEAYVTPTAPRLGATGYASVFRPDAALAAPVAPEKTSYPSLRPASTQNPPEAVSPPARVARDWKTNGSM